MQATDAMIEAALKTADYLGGKEDVYTRAHWYELGDDDVKAVVDAALAAAPPNDDAVTRVLEAADRLRQRWEDMERHDPWTDEKTRMCEAVNAYDAAVAALRETGRA